MKWTEADGVGRGRRLARLATVALALYGAWSLLPGLGTGSIPIEEGQRLAALALGSDKPIVIPEGILVREVRGCWAQMQMGPDASEVRWVNLEQVRIFAAMPDED